MERLKKVPDKFFDLCVADPPYGINITGKHVQKNGTIKVTGDRKPRKGYRYNAFSREYPAFGDTYAPSEEVFKEMERVSKKLIIWGFDIPHG